MLTRDEFFARAPEPKTADVDVPGLGTVRVRMLTVGERDRLETASQGQGKNGVRARVVVASVVREDGSQMFTYADVDRLSALPAYFVEPIIDAASKLNAISAEDIEDLEKN